MSSFVWENNSFERSREAKESEMPIPSSIAVHQEAKSFLE